MHATSSAHAVVSNGNDDSHFENELKQISPEHTPKSPDGDIQPSKGNDDENANCQRLMLSDSHNDAHDADHCLRHPAQNEAIHQ